MENKLSARTVLGSMASWQKGAILALMNNLSQNSKNRSNPHSNAEKSLTEHEKALFREQEANSTERGMANLRRAAQRHPQKEV